MTTKIAPSFLRRAWTQFAPQVLAFLATGLTSSAVLTLLDYIPNVHIPATTVALVVGFVSTVAAFIQKDRALGDDAKTISGKLAAFVLSGVTVTAVVSVSSTFGLHLPEWAPGVAVTVAGLIVGYLKADKITPVA